MVFIVYSPDDAWVSSTQHKLRVDRVIVAVADALNTLECRNVTDETVESLFAYLVDKNKQIRCALSTYSGHLRSTVSLRRQC